MRLSLPPRALPAVVSVHFQLSTPPRPLQAGLRSDGLLLLIRQWNRRTSPCGLWAPSRQAPPLPRTQARPDLYLALKKPLNIREIYNIVFWGKRRRSDIGSHLRLMFQTAAGVFHILHFDPKTTLTILRPGPASFARSSSRVESTSTYSVRPKLFSVASTLEGLLSHQNLLPILFGEFLKSRAPLESSSSFQILTYILLVVQFARVRNGAFHQVGRGQPCHAKYPVCLPSHRCSAPHTKIGPKWMAILHFGG